MKDIEKFAQAIQDADLPMGVEILTALGELYEEDKYHKTLDDMATYFCRGSYLGDVFAGGFIWKTTPQGHAWWKKNVREPLRRVRYER